MMFWDSSAIIPLCLEEAQSRNVGNIAKEDGAMVVWWGSSVECYSAFARLYHENLLDPAREDQVKQIFGMLSTYWIEIEPCQEVKDLAEKLLFLYPLHAADSLQLAAALVWTEKIPRGCYFVCLDHRLRKVARREGFTLLPSEELLR